MKSSASCNSTGEGGHARFPVGLIGPWRRRVQAAGVILLLVLPFLRPGGIGLLRIDIPRGRLEIFGRFLLLEQFNLLLPAILALLVLFLLTTLVLGRLWCGWVCPQTTLSELVETFARRLGLQVSDSALQGHRSGKLLVHGFSAALALLVAMNLVWYFVPPREFFDRLMLGAPGYPATLALCSVALIVYLDLVFVRRLLCREFCPYGRFQSALMDNATLTLGFSSGEAGSCLNCSACVQSCPTGIDIRRGLQVECIACGRCLDACRRVQAPRGGSGLIRYRFGDGTRGPAALLNLRILVLLLVLTGLCLALAIGTARRGEPSFTLSRTAASPRTLPDGRVATFYTAQITNRSPAKLVLGLHAEDAKGRSIELRGSTEKIRLGAYQKQRIDFALVENPGEGRPESIGFILEDGTDRRVGEIRITPPSRQGSSL